MPGGHDLPTDTFTTINTPGWTPSGTPARKSWRSARSNTSGTFQGRFTAADTFRFQIKSTAARVTLVPGRIWKRKRRCHCREPAASSSETSVWAPPRVTPPPLPEWPPLRDPLRDPDRWPVPPSPAAAWTSHLPTRHSFPASHADWQGVRLPLRVCVSVMWPYCFKQWSWAYTQNI